jgi:hypothetical protein
LLSVNQTVFTINAEPTWRVHSPLVFVGQPLIVAQEIRTLPSNVDINGARHCGYVVPAFYRSLICKLAIHSSIWVTSILKWRLEIGVVRTTFDSPSANVNRGTIHTLSFLRVFLCFLVRLLFSVRHVLFWGVGGGQAVKNLPTPGNFCNSGSPLPYMDLPPFLTFLL